MSEKSVILSCCLPKALAEKATAKAKEGGYVSVSDFLRDLVRGAVMN